MRKLLTLGSGLIFTLFAVLLFLRAGIQRSARAAAVHPLRAFLVGILVMEVPLLAASCFRLAGAEELGALALLLFFGALLILLWPANVALMIGERLVPEENQSRQVAVGSFVAATSVLVPVVGWLWLFYLVALATGGFCLRGRYA